MKTLSLLIIQLSRIEYEQGDLPIQMEDSLYGDSDIENLTINNIKGVRTVTIAPKFKTQRRT